MRKLLLSLALAGALASLLPANAATLTKRVTFKAAVPCAAVCTYWMPHQESPGSFAVLPEAAAAESVLDTVEDAEAEYAVEEETGTDVPSLEFDLPVIENDVDKAYDKEAAYACSAPSPEGSWADLVVTAPKWATRLRITYTPEVDWDVWLCSKPKVGNNGRLLAKEAVATIDECQATCPSSLTAVVKPNTKYVIRAYNFSDPADLVATYKFYS